MAISDAVGLERVARVLGYKLTKGVYNNSSPNLPQRIAVLCEANNANQSTLSATGGLLPYQITSAQDAGSRYGYGSPAHIIARILFPSNGGGTVGGIPVYIYPQLAAGGATSQKQTITVTGPATAGGTHSVVIGGRYGVDGSFYSFNVSNGDSAATIATAIANAINNVLGSPVTASLASPITGVITLETKWKGLTANDITVSVDTGNSALGLTYAIATTQAGAGTPSIGTGSGNTTGLDFFGSTWNTIVLNSYTLYQSTVISSLETFNGIPDPNTPTGRYAAIIWKPFIAVTGNVTDSTATSADVVITDADSSNVTIAVAPAPASKALPMEAAANCVSLFCRYSQDTPQLDIQGQSYPDMPVATTIPATADYTVRDAVVKKGMSTALIVAGAYQVQDFVTTYHPAGENPPQYQYPRNLMLDYNVKYGVYLLEEINVVNHLLANDADNVTAANVIKPKQWKAILGQYADDLTSRGLVADPNFTKGSIQVGISTTNPNRLETFFRYKRTGVARIVSTTGEAGFNFGNA